MNSKLIIGIFLVLIIFQGYSQNSSNLIISGKIIDANTNGISDVSIGVYLNNKLFSETKTANNGQINALKVPFNHVFNIVFSKKGYISKVVILNLNINTSLCDDFSNAIINLPIAFDIVLDTVKAKVKYPKDAKMGFVIGRFLFKDCILISDVIFYNQQYEKYKKFVY